MPVFNGEHYINEAIGSVLAQCNTDLELIVVNDGSTDKTLDFLQAYSKQDARVRVISRPNSGRPSFPKNDGIAAARGEYVCFLDHDDLYDPDRTWQMAEALDRHPDWVAAFHDLRMIDSEGELLPGTYLSDGNFLQRAQHYLTPLGGDLYECGDSFFVYQSLVTGALHTQSVLIAINRIPPGTVQFDTQFTICEDTDLWIRLGMLGKMGYLDRVLSSYRQHENSITRNRERLLLDTLRLHQHNFQRVKNRLSSAEMSQYKARISSCHSELGYVQYTQYRLNDARKAYRKALAWSFTQGACKGYLKTLIPKGVLQSLKGLMSN
jgi:glycosyltransferase involved in cell wall biosynthesis